MRLFRKNIQGDLGSNVDYSTTQIVHRDKWVIAQRRNVSLIVSNGLLETSLDNSKTVAHSRNFLGTDRIDCAHILKNGNILFTTFDNKIYLTNFSLSFIKEKKVLLQDGTEMPIHTPVNPALPGRYFYTHRYMSTTEDTDLYLWANYGNLNHGAAPIQIFYTADFGHTVKVAYTFGVNPRHKDDGTREGSSTGNPLGDPSNSIICRHSHSVDYCKENGKWYCFTGDNDSINENHWMEGTYDPITDTWSWVELDFGFIIDQRSRLKIIEGIFHGGFMIWNTDATQVDPSFTDSGIWRAPIEHLTDLSKHEKIADFPQGDDYSSNMKLDPNTGVLLFTIANIQRTNDKASTIGVVENFGDSVAQYLDLSSFGYNCIRLNSPNDEGYFRLDTQKFHTLQNKSLFIKVGENLLENIIIV